MVHSSREPFRNYLEVAFSYLSLHKSQQTYFIFPAEGKHILLLTRAVQTPKIPAAYIIHEEVGPPPPSLVGSCFVGLGLCYILALKVH